MTRPDPAALLQAFRQELAAVETLDALEAVRRTHTGKKSPLKLALRGLGQVPPEERPQVAKALNDAQREVVSALEEAKATLAARQMAKQVDDEWTDLGMPGLGTPRGARHPVTTVERQCLDVLRRLGFSVVDGPEVESAFYNFDALNIPEHHPARDMQDTFWVQGGGLLRSHTTTVQARVLEACRPRAGAPAQLPIKMVSMGRVYRNEAVDATHLAMFHQFEGLWIEPGLTFADLKGVLGYVVSEVYGADRVRFKPKFYPYTEPSVGVDLACGACDGEGCPACHGAGWVTILGAGMVHPKVFLQFGYDPDKVSGIAFGLGTTRMAAQTAGVTKVRSLYEPDLRTLHALHRGQ